MSRSAPALTIFNGPNVGALLHHRPILPVQHHLFGRSEHHHAEEEHEERTRATASLQLGAGGASGGVAARVGTRRLVEGKEDDRARGGGGLMHRDSFHARTHALQKVAGSPSSWHSPCSRVAVDRTEDRGEKQSAIVSGGTVGAVGRVAADAAPRTCTDMYASTYGRKPLSPLIHVK